MIISDFFDLIYPNCCTGCNKILGRGEDSLCAECLLQLPLTGFEKEWLNPVSNELFGRVPLKEASAIFYFTQGGILQKMLHTLKYSGGSHIGAFLGKKAGKILAACGRYDKVDCIVPVPVNTRKEKLRGYNQAKVIAEGLLAHFNRPILENILIKPESGDSQTRKNRYERYENMLDGFSLSENIALLENKHILLVDDVVTTGATVERCAKELLKIANVSVSVVAIATPM
ncbi:MAG: ComF family protein [Bacteroidales bacterium]|jgi:ComF family protein|nr:ComF family protein [Bacteroidales bacterium]